jgi:hypothetical protein
MDASELSDQFRPMSFKIHLSNEESRLRSWRRASLAESARLVSSSLTWRNCLLERVRVTPK